MKSPLSFQLRIDTRVLPTGAEFKPVQEGFEPQIAGVIECTIDTVEVDGKDGCAIAMNGCNLAIIGGLPPGFETAIEMGLRHMANALKGMAADGTKGYKTELRDANGKTISVQ